MTLLQEEFPTSIKRNNSNRWSVPFTILGNVISFFHPFSVFFQDVLQFDTSCFVHAIQVFVHAPQAKKKKTCPCHTKKRPTSTLATSTLAQQTVMWADCEKGENGGKKEGKEIISKKIIYVIIKKQFSALNFIFTPK